MQTIMRSIAVLVLALAGSVETTSAACTTSSKLPVPVLIWAPQATFSGQNVYAGLEGLDETDAATLVDQISGFESDSSEPLLDAVKYDADHGKSQATVLFLAPELSAKEVSEALGSFEQIPGSKAVVKTLRSAFDAAKSSLVLPFVVDSSRPGTQSAWSRWAFGKNPETLITVQDPTQDAKVLDSELGAKSAAGKLKVVVMLPEDIASWNVAIGNTLETLKKHVADRYVAVFTGDNAKKAPSHPMTNNLVELSTSRRRLDAFPDISDTQVRNTPHIMAGLLVSLMLVLTTALYMCCLDGMQIPTYFIKEYPPLGKVYD